MTSQSNPKASAKGVRRLDELLSQHMQARGYAQSLQADEIRQFWEQLVGGIVAGYAVPGQVKRGTLEVFVSNSTVLQELTFRRAELVVELQRVLPGHRIANIQFRVR